MPSAIKWETTSAQTSIMTTALNSLANNTLSAVSTEVNNSTGLNTYAWFEINVTFGVAPSDTAPTLDIYMTQAPDGTNYQSAPVTSGTDQAHLFFASVPVRKVTTAQRLVFGPYPLPPHKCSFYVDNQTGQSMAASGNTVHIYTNNLESQ